MNINIYIDDQLGEQLTNVAKSSNNSIDAVIEEAISLWLKTNKKSEWPDDVLEYEGIADFPSFESYREDLADAKDTHFT